MGRFRENSNVRWNCLIKSGLGSPWRTNHRLANIFLQFNSKFRGIAPRPNENQFVAPRAAIRIMNFDGNEKRRGRERGKEGKEINRVRYRVWYLKKSFVLQEKHFLYRWNRSNDMQIPSQPFTIDKVTIVYSLSSSIVSQLCSIPTYFSIYSDVLNVSSSRAFRNFSKYRRYVY